MKRFALPLFFGVLFFTSSCAQENSQKNITPLQDSSSSSDTGTDESTNFFEKGKKVANPSTVFIIQKDKKKISLKQLLTSDEFGARDYALSDLDNDGKDELVAYEFTGGAHCCDVITIFKNTAPNAYSYAASLFAGNTLVTKEKEFEYGLYESFGYFFTCFACSLSDTTASAPVPVNSIRLKYNKGKLEIVKGDQQLLQTINDNLKKICLLPYMKLDTDDSFDDGLRKEVALNAAVYYFSFGKDINSTKKLFYSYYKYPDANKVWSEFAKTISHIKSESSL